MDARRAHRLPDQGNLVGDDEHRTDTETGVAQKLRGQRAGTVLADPTCAAIGNGDDGDVDAHDPSVPRREDL